MLLWTIAAEPTNLKRAEAGLPKSKNIMYALNVRRDRPGGNRVLWTKTVPPDPKVMSVPRDPGFLRRVVLK
jgi:hypothetical protein